MKRILIIHAHPESKSFCASLMREAIRHFEASGKEIRVHDLYADGFDPVGGKNDFTGLQNEDFFKYQLEQVHAYENRLFTNDLQKRMDDLEWCDVLVFSYPLWWFSLPAILKGWVDRVFAMGFVYGNGKGVYDNGVYSEKTAMVLMTTGGPDIAYNGGKNGDMDTILFPVLHGMFYFTGMTVLPPFISYAPARKTEEERESELKRLGKYLDEMHSVQPIYTNR